MASVAKQKLFVVGGSGFLGQAICQAALSKGWEVLSLSRHGSPSSQGVGPSLSRVQWIKGDALKPETFQDHLVGCAAVVHSVGVIMESNYKQYINAGSSSNTTHQATTYESANRDTALSVAQAARNTPGLNAFAYISAADVVPLLSHRYISTKREVESHLLAHKDELRPVILRPGFMFSSTRPVSLPIAAGVSVFNSMFHRTPLGCVLKNTPFAKAAHQTLRREIVANAVVNAISQPAISGVLNIEDIERIGVN